MAGEEERIDALETRVAFQDDTIQQLNDALVAQQERLDRLQAELRELIATLNEGVGDATIKPADEVPPHY